VGADVAPADAWSSSGAGVWRACSQTIASRRKEKLAVATARQQECRLAL
jgi:hypothetical protein